MLTNFVTLSSATVIAARTLGPDDRGRMFLVDCTNSFGGFSLPQPSRFGVGVVGMQKIDDTANPCQATSVTGVSVNGYDYFACTIRGDTVVFACDGTQWIVLFRSSTVKRFFAEHRTLVASAGQTAYQSLTTDRHALIRANADSAAIVITLPVKTAFTPNRGGMGQTVTPPGAYYATWFCGVLRTSTSAFNVTIKTSDGTTINSGSGATGIVMSGSSEMRLVDFDSSEWLAHKLLTT